MKERRRELSKVVEEMCLRAREKRPLSVESDCNGIKLGEVVLHRDDEGDAHFVVEIEGVEPGAVDVRDWMKEILREKGFLVSNVLIRGGRFES